MKTRIVSIFTALVIALSVVLGGQAYLDVLAQNVACYREQGGAKQVAGSGCEFEFRSGSTLDVQSGATETHANNPVFSGSPSFTGAPTFSGASATINGFLIFPSQAITVSAGFIITPTKSYVVLNSTAEVTSSTTIPVEETGITAGTILIIRNGNAANPINLDGTGGSVECKANIALGADDTLTLIYNGTEWNCQSSYDNS